MNVSVIEQSSDALSCVQHAGGGALRVLVLAAARERFRASRFVFGQQCFV